MMMYVDVPLKDDDFPLTNDDSAELLLHEDLGRGESLPAVEPWVRFLLFLIICLILD